MMLWKTLRLPVIPVVWIIACVCHAQPDAAVSPTLGTNPGSGINQVAVANGRVFFAATVQELGAELWAFDPQKQQTELVHDIYPGYNGAEPNQFYTFKDRLYFHANTQVAGKRALWASDGTLAGTRRLLLINTTRDGTPLPACFAAFGDILLFAADDGIQGRELWRTDGTEAGTRLVRDIHPPGVAGGTTFSPCVFRDMAFFRAVSNGDGKRGELWRTDGTDRGTRQIDVPGLVIEPFQCTMVALDYCVVFPGRTAETGLELWRTDGTVKGTYAIRDIFPGPLDSEPGQLVRLGDVVLFQAKDVLHGAELWKTDGTSMGTVLVADLSPGKADSRPFPLRVAQDVAYLTAETPEWGRELWFTDGTKEGTHLVLDLNPGTANSNPYAIATRGRQAFFSADSPGIGEELWISDGTPQGTHVIRDINPGLKSSEPYNSQVLGDISYFSANDGIHGEELWRSDGTAEGTYLVADVALPPGAALGAKPSLLTPGTDFLYFIARAEDGYCRLWRSDGTIEGTLELAKSPADFRRSAFLNIAPVAGAVFVACHSNRDTVDLWCVDEASRSARRVASMGTHIDVTIGSRLAAMGSSLYFAGYDEGTGTELRWISVPDLATELVADIEPGPSGSAPHSLTHAGNRLYFVASDRAHGEELRLVVSGKAGIVRDIRPGSDGSAPRSLLAVGDRIFFTADDGVHGPELWVSQGTPESTRLVADINPVQHEEAIRPSSLTAFGEALLFAANNGVHGTELWRSGGRPESTGMIDDIFAGPASSNPEGLTVVGGRAYFRAETPTHGLELFASDGTVAGTHLLRDLVLGPAGGRPNHLASLGNLLLFAGRQATQGAPTGPTELFWTDGVKFGQFGVSVSSASADPADLTVVKDTLYFTADDSVHGRELWKVDYQAQPEKLNPQMVKDILPYRRTTIPLGDVSGDSTESSLPSSP